MNKVTSIFLTALVSMGFSGTGFATDADTDADTGSTQHLSGKDLLAEDQKQIDGLKAKKEDLQKAGGDDSVIDALIKLAEEMMELNNKRHAVHAATEAYSKAIGIFSEDIKQIIEKVNAILNSQASAAIKNSQAIALLKPTGGAAPGETPAAASHDDKEDEEE